MPTEPRTHATSTCSPPAWAPWRLTTATKCRRSVSLRRFTGPEVERSTDVMPREASFWARWTWGDDRSSHARDVRCEEVHAVAVEVAAGAVLMLGNAWVGVASQDLGIAERHAGVQGALVIAACRSECGLMGRAMPAALAILRTIR